jgi:hypothetical protein
MRQQSRTHCGKKSGTEYAFWIILSNIEVLFYLSVLDDEKPFSQQQGTGVMCKWQ